MGGCPGRHFFVYAWFSDCIFARGACGRLPRVASVFLFLSFWGSLKERNRGTSNLRFGVSDVERYTSSGCLCLTDKGWPCIAEICCKRMTRRTKDGCQHRVPIQVRGFGRHDERLQDF